MLCIIQFQSCVFDCELHTTLLSITQGSSAQWYSAEQYFLPCARACCFCSLASFCNADWRSAVQSLFAQLSKPVLQAKHNIKGFFQCSCRTFMHGHTTVPSKNFSNLTNKPSARVRPHQVLKWEQLATQCGAGTGVDEGAPNETSIRLPLKTVRCVVC